jgi:hypothetical protein
MRRLDSQKLVDASATMGANLALARREEKKWLLLSSNSRVEFSFGICSMTYDRMAFNGNGLLFKWGTIKKQNYPLALTPWAMGGE